MTATYTFDVFSSLDGFGAASGNWTGYWGKQGPELLDHRLALYGAEQRMVFGASTYRAFARMLASSTEESEVRGPLGDPDAEPAGHGGVDHTGRDPSTGRTRPSCAATPSTSSPGSRRSPEEPLRSHGSLSMNRALMAAGLVNRVQVTIFPVITGQTGLTRSSGVRPTSTWS